MTAIRSDDLADHREVVRDEDVGEVELALQVLQQVQDLRLHRDVERRDRLVADDQLRLERERARDPDPLALAAGELVRVAVDVLGREADAGEQLADAALHVLLGAVDRERLADDLADALARVQRRVRVLEDDLHLLAQRPQPALRQLGDVDARRSGSCRHVGSSRRTISRAVVDLPQPDSPTIPSVSPLLTVSVTSSTACTTSLPRENTPCLTGKCFVRCSTSTSGPCPARCSALCGALT